MSFLLFVGTCEYGTIWVGTQRTNAFGIVDCVNGIDKLQVFKVVDVDSVFENNDDSRMSADFDLLVFSQSDCFDVRLKA